MMASLSKEKSVFAIYVTLIKWKRDLKLFFGLPFY